MEGSNTNNLQLDTLDTPVTQVTCEGYDARRPDRRSSFRGPLLSHRFMGGPYKGKRFLSLLQ